MLGQTHWAGAICDAPPAAPQDQQATPEQAAEADGGEEATEGAGSLAAPGVPAVDFSAELPAIDFVPAQVAAERAVIPAATTTHYVMNCRHPPATQTRRGGGETERTEWQARCGWPYGVRQFFRLHDLPPNPSMCRRCFPDTPVDLEAPEAVSSSGSSSSTSGATSDPTESRRPQSVGHSSRGADRPVLLDTGRGDAAGTSPRGPEKKRQCLGHLSRNRRGSRPPTLLSQFCRFKLSAFSQPWPPHRRWRRRWCRWASSSTRRAGGPHDGRQKNLHPRDARPDCQERRGLHDDDRGTLPRRSDH